MPDDFERIEPPSNLIPRKIVNVNGRREHEI